MQIERAVPSTPQAVERKRREAQRLERGVKDEMMGANMLRASHLTCSRNSAEPTGKGNRKVEEYFIV